ncbi:carboxypeptidase-like regulatory domain-containing protein [Mucilaginibacter sp. HMF5004]|uniref:carboxypeptidase-like regulatory domain-containing protein n=1 Tax=Mucilaginibacter rivuli TaxID=2857527 RepID=UPI001C5E60F3|nr:carboxypeptidase-like regulatory domain-containing protein [Mucilaginibacter rivuli]MBW4889099.1 carboxypeptidase-like regulatory domain-containing protein [Mucilaginibacter rivuli]
MRFLHCLLLVFILPTLAFAQTVNITGKVTSTDIGGPLVKASVFLTNSTFGTSTAANGSFTLYDVKPGQYEIVVTFVGYESYHQTILVGAKPINLNIEMHLKNNNLETVNIVRHPFSPENFKMFTKYFLGTSDNAKKCKILNPTDIDLYYHPYEKSLVGRADEFIIIENKSLGYRIKYLLGGFKFDDINQIISYGGQYQFEDLKGSKKQVAAWKKKREDAFYGSSMHFYRSLLGNNLDSAGFVIYQLIRKPNTERPPQVVIVKNIDKFIAQNNIDSANHWKELYNLNRYHETLIKQPLSANDIFRKTDQPGVFGITFPDCLYVVYKRKFDNDGKSMVYRPLNMPNYASTIITLYQPYAFFDTNGVIVSNKATLYEGAWSHDNIADLLPVDYAPGDKK